MRRTTVIAQNRLNLIYAVFIVLFFTISLVLPVVEKIVEIGLEHT